MGRNAEKSPDGGPVAPGPESADLKCSWSPSDVEARPTMSTETIAEITKHFGRIATFLFNNADINVPSSPKKSLSLAEWQEVIGTNP